MRLREQTDEVMDITEVKRFAASDWLEMQLPQSECDMDLNAAGSEIMWKAVNELTPHITAACHFLQDRRVAQQSVFDDWDAARVLPQSVHITSPQTTQYSLFLFTCL